ncbi:MAG: transposase [Candidatus Altiarchaeales archaeon]|nr:transposase [Candidatus Altiarchaeales archaeon]
MIRSSKHSLGKTNTGKTECLHRFIERYRLLLRDIIDHLWEKGFRGDQNPEYEKKKKEWWYWFDLKKDKLRLPSMLPSWFLEKHFSEAYPEFTQRMLQCAGKQACSMIHAEIEEQKRRFWVLRSLQKKGTPSPSLQRKFNKTALTKPSTRRANPELDPRFVDFEEGEFFDSFVQLKLWKIEKGTKRKEASQNGYWIRVPLEETKVSNKWKLRLKRLGSIRLSRNCITLFYKGKTPKKSGKVILGADQGVNRTLTLSDGWETQKCPHGHDWRSILEKKNRCAHGSKGFRRACTHEENYVNWSLNQYKSWSKVQELFLEEVRDLRKGRRQRKGFLRHWRYPLVTEKCERLSEEEGFFLGRTPNMFRSQRCSVCGWVRKANRKRAVFLCTSCGNTLGADLNAAINNSMPDLFKIPVWVRSGKYNRKGFFWTPEGVFYPTGERIVPSTPKTG